MEFVVAEIERSVDGLERLEIYINFLLFPFICDNSSAIDNLNNKHAGGSKVVEVVVSSPAH